MTIRFNDGVEFDPNGDYRIEMRHDGMYVVGHGLVCAVETREEGEELIKTLRRRRNETGAE